jgi:hypothetical protein
MEKKEMRRKVIALISTLLLGLVLITPVAAQTSQGLDWTVDVGDQYHFNVYYWEGILVHEDMYLNVTSNHAILPDPLTDWWNIPEPPIEVYYANGTDPGIISLVFMFSWKIAVPIGNWTLMTELVEDVTTWPLADSVDSVNVVMDTWLHWGFTYNVTSDPRVIVCNSTCLKSDGVLAWEHLLAYDIATQAFAGELILLRDGVAPVVENPDDISYEQGETGHSITWNATDQNPGGYMIFKDDVDVKHGFWNSSSEMITANVDDLNVGSHNYTIVFYEASGKSTSDTVMVDVSAPPVTTTTTTTSSTTTPPPDGFDLSQFLSENMLLIGLGGGVVVLVILIVVLKKR